MDVEPEREMAARAREVLAGGVEGPAHEGPASRQGHELTYRKGRATWFQGEQRCLCRLPLTARFWLGCCGPSKQNGVRPVCPDKLILSRFDLKLRGCTAQELAAYSGIE